MSKNMRGKGKPKPPLAHPTAADVLADLRRRALAAQSTDECISINKLILKLEAAARGSRPKGTQPDSQKGIRDARAKELLQDRQDARTPFAYGRPQAYSRPIPHVIEAPTSATSAVPLRDTLGHPLVPDAPEVRSAHRERPVEPSVEPSPAPDPTVLIYAIAPPPADWPVPVTVPQVPAPPPAPPPTPPPALTPALRGTPVFMTPVPAALRAQGVVATSDDPWVIECLAKYAERDRLKAEQIEAEKAEAKRLCAGILAAATPTDPAPVPVRAYVAPPLLPRADYDVPDARVCRTDQPEHKDGYWEEKVEITNEARHNLTLENF